ncbi:MAG TPA: hypothetical protein VNN73_09615 [Blastocatellia bacterium]|jgi:hypothetical protein|nr:hypothetical protein [Blastocatellia bacterium]
MSKASVAGAKTRFDQAAERFYQSGARYLAALDAWIEVRADELRQLNSRSAAGAITGHDAISAIKAELKELRSQREQTEELLHRLFSDEFADTCSAGE